MPPPDEHGSKGHGQGGAPSARAPEVHLPPPRPPMPTLRSADDLEQEDTVSRALAPLSDAELGQSTPPPSVTAPSVRIPIDFVGDDDPLPPEPEGNEPPVGLAACLARIGVAVIETDRVGNVITLNAVAERLTGWPVAEARGASIEDVFCLVPPTSQGPEATLAMELGAAPPEHTALLQRRDGQEVPIRHVVGLAGPGEHGGEIITFRDISGQQFMALQLAREKRHDALTGLLNRRALAERIDVAITESRKSGARHALVYLDLDRFRIVNATCGHDAGDDMLQWVATRVNELLGARDAAGRIGGDEFALLLLEREPREAERVARELMRRLGEFRFGFQDKSFVVGASFGVVPFGAEMGRSAEVLGAADHACRVAKDAGRGRVQMYLESDDGMQQSRRSIRWVAGLQRNLEDGRLKLFAQGIHPLDPERQVGAHFEVLVRLVDEAGRFQSPVGIIQAAEHSGMMDAIDRFVVRQAFRMIGALPQRAMRRLDTCAINLSGVSLVREGLLDFIVQEMHRANVPPGKICFEVTETAALANLGEVLWLMQELGAMGCRFAVDDFGSGHASYGYIESLPVDYVKIDGMFVRDLGDNALHRAIVESVHRIGCTLGIKTVAEQVETSAIADLLRGIGVDYAQGWLYGKPQPMAEVLGALDVP